MGLLARIRTLFFQNKVKGLGIAFGSGGAKGMAHLGVLKAFEEEGIRFSFVTGTSIGSIVGALYAKGYTSSDMSQIIENINRREFSKGLNPFTEGSYAENFLSQYLDGTFSELNLPFAAWATDGDTGKGVLLSSGKLARALAASSAIPPYFRSVEIDGRRLYDGAFSNAIPSDVCRSLGARFVVGVDLSAFQKPDEEKTRLTRILDSAISRITPVRYTSDCRSRGYENADFMLCPNLRNYRATDVSREAMNRMYELGYEEARSKMPEFKKTLMKRTKR